MPCGGMLESPGITAIRSFSRTELGAKLRYSHDHPGCAPRTKRGFPAGQQEGFDDAPRRLVPGHLVGYCRLYQGNGAAAWVLGDETAIVVRARDRRRRRFPKVASPDILEDLRVSLPRSGRARSGERRSPRSVQEALPSAGLVRGRT